MQQKLWQTALKKLSIKPISSAEMQTFLKNKFPQQEREISGIMDELNRLHLLNDDKLLEQLLDYLTERPIGRFKIENEVKKRLLGVDRITELLNQKGWSEQESAKKAIEIKSRTLNEKNPQKRKQKIMLFLKSRGFSGDIIYKLFDHL